ncbi:MAG TPA: MFS transporter [Acidimicrobiales bacterium]|nr:MFS transporter [Acidimicrobiales bacterium]
MTATAPDMAPQALDPRRWWVLALLCTSLLIVIVGNTSLNTALPTLSRELKATITQLQWMVDAYSLVFAGLLLTAGALGDRFGRKGALQIGLGLFALSCVAASQASSAGQLIAVRAVMGIAAAFIMPSTLSLLTNVFPPHERAKAIAIWAGVAGGGAAIGPISSGYLVEHFWWGSVFLVNVPIIVVALLIGRTLLPKSKDPDQGRLDPLGAVLSTVGISTLVYAIIEAPGHGWGSPQTIAAFAAAVVLLGLFAAWEIRTPTPMLDLGFFRNPQFSVAAGGIALIFFAMFGMFFLIAQYFQLVLGYTPFQAGIRQGPVALVIMIVAPNSAPLAHRFGANRVVAAGLLLVSIAMLMNSRLALDTGYPYILLSMSIMACGMALTMSPMTASIMASVPMNKAGIGSAINDTTRELGGALGVAVLGSLVTSRYVHLLKPAVMSLPADAASATQRSLAGALGVARNLPATQAHDLVMAARSSFVSGIQLAAVTAAIVAMAASAIVLRLLPPSLGPGD